MLVFLFWVKDLALSDLRNGFYTNVNLIDDLQTLETDVSRPVIEDLRVCTTPL